MKRLGVLVVLLVLGSALLIGGAKLYGGSHAEPNRLQQLEVDLCDGRPCWEGNVPGVTDWDTFMGRSASHGEEFSSGPSLGVQFERDGYTVTALGLQNPKLVTSIGLSATNALLLSKTGPGRLGDALNLFGPPCGVEISNKDMSLLYSRVDIDVPVINGRVDLTTSIVYMYLLDPTLVPGMASPDLCKPKAGYTVVPWKGLALTSDYYLPVPD